jgi:polar amino acid transport system substrate-binding protein
LFFLVTFLFVVVGCGGGQQTPTPAPAPETTKLTVASDTAYAPFEMQGGPGEPTYVGFDMDLIRAIGEVLGKEVEIISMGFDGIIPALQSGSVDCAISAMTITEERAKVVNFSEAYYESGLITAVRADNNDINGFEDLAGKKIAVQIGTTGALKAEEVPDAKITTFNTIDLAFLELKKGAVDAVINDAPVTLYFIQQGNDDVKVVGGLLTGEFYGIAVPKAKPDLLDEINGALKTLKENGTFDRIYMDWFGQEPPDTILQF